MILYYYLIQFGKQSRVFKGPILIKFTLLISPNYNVSPLFRHCVLKKKTSVPEISPL